MNLHSLGTLSLNCSFIAYIVVYLPQILHNQRGKHLHSYSVGMHFTLYCGYFLDLLYGFSSQLPWQYKTVSCVGMILLMIQHLQITRLWWENKALGTIRPNLVGPRTNLPCPKLGLGQTNILLIIFNVCFLLTTICAIIYYFIPSQKTFSSETTTLIGSGSRLLFICASIPQIIRNYRTQHAGAISIKYIYLNLAICGLDTVSAWCLNWGWPNKISPLIMLALYSILLNLEKAINPQKKLLLPRQWQMAKRS